MTALDRAPLVEPGDRAAWREWLERNHASATGVWLVSRRRRVDRGDLDYGAAVEEALCFGWIDGQAAGVDERRLKQYFAPRRPRSTWSTPNEERFHRMLAAGQVAPAGLGAYARGSHASGLGGERARTRAGGVPITPAPPWQGGVAVSARRRIPERSSPAAIAGPDEWINR